MNEITMNVEVGAGGLSPAEPSTAWVRDELEPGQLSRAKQPFGRRVLSGPTIVLLWGLRVYVLLMVLLIGFQVWNAVRGAK